MGVNEMKCCNNCKYKLSIEKLDYSKGGCIHTKMDGFICLAFADEGVANWMLGICPESGMCECFTSIEGDNK